MSPLNTDGYSVRAFDPALLQWVHALQPLAAQILQDATHDHWWRHGRTWFAGVNVVPNDAQGRVAGSPPLPTALGDDIREQVQIRADDRIEWEHGQLSVVRPGYPQSDGAESQAAASYRRNRDAAHVDGLLPVGPNRLRMPQEFHRFILGIPLQHAPAHAAPTVVWQGSHKLIQQAFIEALKDIPIQDWPQTDLSDVYQRKRREVFDCCKRVEVRVSPGACFLTHRFAVHGVAPWEEQSGDQGKLRSIVFFRPEIGSRWDWLVGD